MTLDDGFNRIEFREGVKKMQVKTHEKLSYEVGVKQCKTELLYVKVFNFFFVVEILLNKKNTN